MKKLYFILAALMLLAMTACDSSDDAKSGKEGGNYAWEFIERKDYEGQLEFTMDYASFEFDYSPADYGVSWVYTGETDESRNIRHGESWSGRCTLSEPPQVINVGDTLTLDFSITETENSLGAWWVECNAHVYFFYQKGSDPKNSDPHIDFKDSEGIEYLTTNSKEGPTSLKKSLSAVAPDGKPGNRIQVILGFQFDDAYKAKQSIRTVYIYELKKQ